MGDILSVGLGVGVVTSAWCLATGGGLALALLAYSVGGTIGSLTTAVFVAALEERRHGI